MARLKSLSGWCLVRCNGWGAPTPPTFSTQGWILSYKIDTPSSLKQSPEMSWGKWKVQMISNCSHGWTASALLQVCTLIGSGRHCTRWNYCSRSLRIPSNAKMRGLPAHHPFLFDSFVFSVCHGCVLEARLRHRSAIPGCIWGLRAGGGRGFQGWGSQAQWISLLRRRTGMNWICCPVRSSLTSMTCTGLGEAQKSIYLDGWCRTLFGLSTPLFVTSLSKNFGMRPIHQDSEALILSWSSSCDTTFRCFCCD